MAGDLQEDRQAAVGGQRKDLVIDPGREIGDFGASHARRNAKRARMRSVANHDDDRLQLRVAWIDANQVGETARIGPRRELRSGRGRTDGAFSDGVKGMAGRSHPPFVVENRPDAERVHRGHHFRCAAGAEVHLAVDDVHLLLSCLFVRYRALSPWLPGSSRTRIAL